MGTRRWGAGSWVAVFPRPSQFRPRTKAPPTRVDSLGESAILRFMSSDAQVTAHRIVRHLCHGGAS